MQITNMEIMPDASVTTVTQTTFFLKHWSPHSFSFFPFQFRWKHAH